MADFYDPVPTSRILRTNLLVLLAMVVLYSVLLWLSEGATGVVVYAIGIACQVVYNLICGFAGAYGNPGAYFLSALLVLLIGFGTCMGIMPMFLMG